MSIRVLKQAKATALDSAKALQSSAAGRMMTAEEQTAFVAHVDEAKSLQSQIDAAEALQEMERTEPAASSIQVGQNHAENKPWGSFGEQLKAVHAAATSNGRNTDPRLYAAMGSNESVDSEGGFLVAPEYADTILQRTYNEGEVTSRCQTIPMRSNRLVMNGLDEDSRATGQRYGGIQVFRAAEAAKYTSSKPAFKQVTLNANKLIGLLYATDELLEDSNALAKWSYENFPKAFGFQCDDEVINGSGQGQMLGILKSGAPVVVAKETNQAAGTVTTSNVLGMHKRLWGPSRSNAAWMVNADLEDQLWNLTRGSGTAVELLYTGPGERGNNNAYGVMMGHPVLFIEQASAAGTVGDIILGDFSQYLIGQKEGLKTDSSIHVQFLTGEQVFRWTLRNDGQPIQKAPLTPYKGSNTLSSFVTLAARG